MNATALKQVMAWWPSVVELVRCVARAYARRRGRSEPTMFDIWALGKVLTGIPLFSACLAGGTAQVHPVSSALFKTAQGLHMTTEHGFNRGDFQPGDVATPEQLLAAMERNRTLISGGMACGGSPRRLREMVTSVIEPFGSQQPLDYDFRSLGIARAIDEILTFGFLLIERELNDRLYAIDAVGLVERHIPAWSVTTPRLAGLAAAWCQDERHRSRNQFFVSPFPPWAKDVAEYWGYAPAEQALEEDDAATIHAVLARLSDAGAAYPPSLRDALLDSLGLTRQTAAHLASLRHRIDELLQQKPCDSDHWFSSAEIRRVRGESFLERFLREHHLGVQF